MRDYTAFLERAEAQMPAPGGDADPGELGELAVRAVSLSYPERDGHAVEDLSIVITRGQTVAFVGENGSGKSSLAALIADLRDPDRGVITWNGRPYHDLDPGRLQARIGVVSQDYHRWPFSVATNIALGDISAEPDPGRIHTAAHRAMAHQVVAELPHGYDTLLDRTFAEGQDLSGGLSSGAEGPGQPEGARLSGRAPAHLERQRM